MQANKGSRASRGWSSLLVGRDIIKADGVWWIGDRQSIRVFTDRWVTSRHDFRISQPEVMDSRTNNTMVESWMEPGSRRWNEQVVRRAVGQVNVDDILRVPIHQTMKHDTLRWSFTKDGRPTVRSVNHR